MKSLAVIHNTVIQAHKQKGPIPVTRPSCYSDILDMALPINTVLTQWKA
jgi:hypothetical protein